MECLPRMYLEVRGLSRAVDFRKGRGLQVLRKENRPGRGCRFAICTNKLEWLSVRLLDALGISRHFAAVCGQDTFGVQKPDPQILLQTIRKAGGQSGCAVMVGDSINDIEVARAARVPVIAVDFGYTETPVSALDPDVVIGDFGKLRAAVDRLLGPQG